jgi:hypothetical protein
VGSPSLCGNSISGQDAVAHLIELHQLAKGQVRMTLTIDVMHNDEWTERAVAGWESELGKLEALLHSRTEDGHA